jgi:hypothetical protein
MLAYRLLNAKVNGTSTPHGLAAPPEAPRKEKLLNVEGARHDTTTTEAKSSLRAPKLLSSTVEKDETHREKTASREEEPTEDTKKQKQNPVAEAKERLKTIDAEIKDQRKKVEHHSIVADVTRDNMMAEAKNQREVATKLRHVKNKTMVAFAKAFELDYELDTLETMHDEAYVAAKNATRLYESSAKAEHEAVAELQRLITQKHRYLHVVSTAEDFETEDAVRRAAKEDEERHSAAPAARTIGLAVVMLWSTDFFRSTST